MERWHCQFWDYAQICTSPPPSPNTQVEASRPLPGQRQVLVPLGARQRAEVFARDVLEGRPAKGLAD